VVVSIARVKVNTGLVHGEVVFAIQHGHRTLDSRTAEPEEDDTTETQRTKEEGPFARPFAALPHVPGAEI
jgi:hypothetical protein